jgi:hypothetical protein
MLLLEGPRMAYVYGLYLYIYIYIYIYIYMHIELIQTSSLFSGNLYPYPSQVIPWIDLPIETPFLESSPRTWKRI